jgi:hypothetical protein
MQQKIWILETSNTERLPTKLKARGHARTGLEDLLAKNNKNTDSITVLNYEILSTRLNLG